MTTQTATQGTEKATVRAYWRCQECLSVFATEVPKPPPGFYGRNRPPSDVHWLANNRPTCGLCEVPTEAMGIVAGSSLLLTVDLQVCDPTCQSAQGPFCDCKCGGVNHGARWVAETKVLYRGGLPVVTRDDPEAQAKARATAAEFRTARDAAREAIKVRWEARGIDRILALKAAGRWVDHKDFAALLAWTTEQKLLREAGTLKTQKSRLKRLTALMAGPEG